MAYSKPEIAVLGDAAQVIQGSKGTVNDSNSLEDLITVDRQFDE